MACSEVAFLQTAGARMFSSQCHNSIVFAVRQIANNLSPITRGGVEDTRLEAKAKDTKKSEAKDSLSEDRPSRGQGQMLWGSGSESPAVERFFVIF